MYALSRPVPYPRSICHSLRVWKSFIFVSLILIVAPINNHQSLGFELDGLLICSVDLDGCHASYCWQSDSPYSVQNYDFLVSTQMYVRVIERRRGRLGCGGWQHGAPQRARHPLHPRLPPLALLQVRSSSPSLMLHVAAVVVQTPELASMPCMLLLSLACSL